MMKSNKKMKKGTWIYTFLKNLKILNYGLSYEIFPTATEHMVILEERAAAKKDKAIRSAKAGLKKTKLPSFSRQVILPANAARTLKTSLHLPIWPESQNLTDFEKL